MQFILDPSQCAHMFPILLRMESPSRKLFPETSTTDQCKSTLFIGVTSLFFFWWGRKIQQQYVDFFLDPNTPVSRFSHQVSHSPFIPLAVWGAWLQGERSKRGGLIIMGWRVKSPRSGLMWAWLCTEKHSGVFRWYHFHLASSTVHRIFNFIWGKKPHFAWKGIFSAKEMEATCSQSHYLKSPFRCGEILLFLNHFILTGRSEFIHILFFQLLYVIHDDVRKPYF